MLRPEPNAGDSSARRRHETGFSARREQPPGGLDKNPEPIGGPELDEDSLAQASVPTLNFAGLLVGMGEPEQGGKPPPPVSRQS